MTKIDIVSGFLGAGKTTLIKKLLKEALANTKVVLIENEFGEIGIDGGFLREAGVEIREMNSGCICCSLVGDFGTSLKEVLSVYTPERILIEPSGVGKLSDVVKAVESVVSDGEVELNSTVAVVDASKCKMYIKNFGEFFLNQIENAGTIILSRTGKLKEDKLAACVVMLREHNAHATIVTTPWEELEGQDILAAIEGKRQLEAELLEELKKEQEHHGHGREESCGCGHGHGEGHHAHGHHSHAYGEEKSCGCGRGHGEGHHAHGHHHGHREEESCSCGHGHGEDHHAHGHHSHTHEEEDHCGHNHHAHGPGCTCGCHDHDHHNHHADEVFASWGLETPDVYTRERLEAILGELEKEDEYGFVLRAKGMVSAGDGTWIHFDYVPGEWEVREGKADVTGKICVIGSQMKEENLKKLFGDKQAWKGGRQHEAGLCY